VGSKGWLYQSFFQRLEELALGDAVALTAIALLIVPERYRERFQ
jgi:hypothetical protein